MQTDPNEQESVVLLPGLDARCLTTVIPRAPDLLVPIEAIPASPRPGSSRFGLIRRVLTDHLRAGGHL